MLGSLLSLHVDSYKIESASNAADRRMDSGEQILSCSAVLLLANSAKVITRAGIEQISSPESRASEQT